MILALFFGPGTDLADPLDALLGVFSLGLAELTVQLVEIGYLAQTKLSRGTPLGAGEGLLGIDICPAMAADVDLVGKNLYLFAAVVAAFDTGLGGHAVLASGTVQIHGYFPFACPDEPFTSAHLDRAASRNESQ